MLSLSAWGRVEGYIRAAGIHSVHVASSLMLESPFPSVLLISRSLPRCHNTHLHLSPFILSIFASSLFPVSLSCITNIPPLFWPSLVLPGLEDLGLSLSAATLPRA